MKDSEDASRLDRDVMGGEATVARRHIRVKARRGPACLLMAIFQGDLYVGGCRDYVGGCREHSGPFLVWHEAFSWTLDQLAARPEADKAPPSHDHLLTLVRDLTRRLAPGRRRNRFWALPRAWLQRLRRAGLTRMERARPPARRPLSMVSAPPPTFERLWPFCLM